jgi:hypothetical protein
MATAPGPWGPGQPELTPPWLHGYILVTLATNIREERAAMEVGGSMVVIGGNLTFILELEDTEMVNQPEDEVVYWTKMAIFAVSLAVNIAAAVVLRQEDDTPINRLIIWDCMINIMTMLIAVVPHRKLSNAYLCSIWHFSYITLIIWNRLVPVGTVVFRYMLVCIAVHYISLK